MYEKIYHFSLLDEVKQGKKIYCCDKKEALVVCVNELAVGTFAVIMAECQKDDTRFEFWTEKEGAK